VRSVLAFAVASVLEIAGCFAFWSWLRRGASPLVALVGCASLAGFAVVLTRADVAFAGRAYAAYGGIYIAASLAWLWIIERQRPTRSDLIGTALAVAGALVILFFARPPSR
jgi:small multidrug resistance family-3 protein